MPLPINFLYLVKITFHTQILMKIYDLLKVSLTCIKLFQMSGSSTFLKVKTCPDVNFKNTLHQPSHTYISTSNRCVSRLSVSFREHMTCGTHINKPFLWIVIVIFHRRPLRPPVVLIVFNNTLKQFSQYCLQQYVHNYNEL